MTGQELQYIITHKRRKPTFIYYALYLFFIIPVILLAMGGLLLVYCIAGPEGFRPLHFLLASAIFVLGIVFFWLLKRRLKENITFTLISTQLTKAENHKLALDILSPRALDIKQTADCIECQTKISWFSWGEIITAIPQDGAILVNSRATGQAITFIKDVKNVRNFRREVDKRLQLSANPPGQRSHPC